MLKIIKDQQQRLITQVLDQLNSGRFWTVERELQGAADGKDQQVSGIDQIQRHEMSAVRKVGAVFVSRLQCQARFANAAGSHQRQQSAVWVGQPFGQVCQ